MRQLLERHYERLAESRVGVAAWTSNKQYEEFLRTHEQRCMKINIARGVYRPATQVELKRLFQAGQKTLPPPASPVIGYLQLACFLMLVVGLIAPRLLGMANPGFGGRNNPMLVAFISLLLFAGGVGLIVLGTGQFIYRRLNSKP